MEYGDVITMSRRFTHKNRLDNPQKHRNYLKSYKSLFYLYNSQMLSNPRIKRTWVMYGKSWRHYSHHIIKNKD